jgi:hypothetical protein
MDLSKPSTFLVGKNINRLSFLSLLAMQVWAVFVYIRHSWQAVNFPYPLDYGEGHLLDQAIRLANFQNNYRVDLSVPPYIVLNYTPLYLLIQAPLVRMLGPAYWYGRALSILSAIGTALLIGLILFSITKDRVASVIGGFTLLSIPYIFYWSSLDRVDTLALMLSWTGLFIVVRWTNKAWSIIMAAILLTAAIYTRQTFGLAAPLTAFLWLWSQNSLRRALLLAGFTSALCLGIFIVLNSLSDNGFFFSVVTANINEFSFERELSFLRKMARYMPYLIASSSVYFLMALKWEPPSWWLAGPYLACSWLTTLLVGKIGSNVNYFIELSSAFSLIVGALIAQQRRHFSMQTVLIFLLTLQTIVLVQWSLSAFTSNQAIEKRTEIEGLMQAVQRTDGLVLADEYMGLLPLAGKSLYIEPIGMKNLARNRLWDQRPFLEAIRQKEFTLILIYPIYAQERWTPQMLGQISLNYEPVSVLADTVVYQPRK